jgi:hypothetical protein
MILARYRLPLLGELGYGSVPTERHPDYPATLILFVPQHKDLRRRISCNSYGVEGLGT